MRDKITLFIVLALLLGSCSVIAGDTSHWPATLAAVVVILAVKVLNDHARILAWPMEFLLAAGVIMIVFNLTRLYFVPLPY